MAVLVASGTILKGPGTPQHISLSVMVVVIPCIYALNFWKSDPCSGLVKWSANIYPVGQCFHVPRGNKILNKVIPHPYVFYLLTTGRHYIALK